MPEHTVKNPTDRPLPPPGDARREELSRRTDELEEMADQVEGGAIDPRNIRIENELARNFNELDVSEQTGEHEYCWVHTGQLGRMVKMKLAEGWEVVTGDMPEARELLQADGTRRLGDVMLMRIRKDRKVLLDRRNRDLRLRQQESVTATLREMGDRAAQHGVTVHTDDDMNPELMKRMANRAAARRTAMGAVDSMLREGRMPGVPAPGRGRR